MSIGGQVEQLITIFNATTILGLDDLLTKIQI